MTTEVQVEDTRQGPYKGKYRTDVYKDSESGDATLVEEEATQNTEEEETISLESKVPDEHNFKKRYDDLKKHYDSKLAEWKEEKEQIMAEKEAEQSFDEVSTPQSNEDIEQFRQEYPEVYNVVERISTQKTSQELEELRAEVERLTGREKELEVKSAYQQLLALHSDFPEIKKSEDFREWLNEQPPSIAEGVANNSSDVKWASRVIDLYKADKGLTKKRGRPRASAADAVTKTSSKTVATNQDANKKIWTTSEIRKLKPHEFDKLEEEIDRANAEGRVV